jgi:hypothetical protein
LERTTQRYPVRALSTPPDGSSILFVNRVAINNASVEETVAMSVKAGCTPRDDVLQGELNDAIFAASFGRLIRDEGPAVYRDPALFFRNTYPTTRYAACASGCSARSQIPRRRGGSFGCPRASGAARRTR